MQHKFKVGDRVVRLVDGFEMKSEYRGEVIAIGDYKVLVYCDQTRSSHGCFFENIEHEYIYDSPLYKALL